MSEKIKGAGKLFVVPTPVGNLGDMAPRAVETLREANLILAEDTRTSAVITRHFDIQTPLASHHKFNEHDTVKPLVDRMLGGEVMALVSDAGTPAISDPGFMLVRECRQAGVEVETLPGPTAFVPALVNSGLPCERFCFEGFLLPRRGGPPAWPSWRPMSARLLYMSRRCAWSRPCASWPRCVVQTATPPCRAKSQSSITPPITLPSANLQIIFPRTIRGGRLL